MNFPHCKAKVLISMIHNFQEKMLEHKMREEKTRLHHRKMNLRSHRVSLAVRQVKAPNIALRKPQDANKSLYGQLYRSAPPIIPRDV
jgi:hypothetical protein